MQNYRVIWEIDLEAESPEEAAKLARAYQNKDTTATVFNVTDEEGKTEYIDLDLMN